MPAKRQSRRPRADTRADTATPPSSRDGGAPRAGGHAARASGRGEWRDGRTALEVGARGHVTEIQRARMIAAMVDVVSERSRAHSTVAHVVARSGVSRRTFYEVFEDFEDCFLAALDQGVERAREYVLRDYDPSQRWRLRVRAGLIGLLEFLVDEPAMGRLCIVETLGAGARVNERRSQLIDQLIRAIDEGRTESRSVAVLPPLTAEGVVGGVLSVLHARLLEGEDSSLLELTGPLMGMIVLPYLGPAATQRESTAAAPTRRERPLAGRGDPLRDLEMRLTYRTVRVLLAIAAAPGSSNRSVGAGAGIYDQGQISKLLSRLERLGLIENGGAGQVRGAPNAWSLTARGHEVERLVGKAEPV
ncbi:MAG TPA: TetR/AcrR family transcriptional regulator [Solirubrobacteraceae bacterium]|jgi:AcrR family transcriptional regulator|nr:TetR/AcrR family transcriptional regulator [Solirubrobacteraceae bacterium]